MVLVTGVVVACPILLALWGVLKASPSARQMVVDVAWIVVVMGAIATVVVGFRRLAFLFSQPRDDKNP
jgi:hypothetical protein